MKNIRNIHQQAMELARNADQARLDGNSQRFRQLSEEAFRLEKEATDELVAHPESEPTRGVLFRSAASLALNIGKLAEAKVLIETALSGNPFPEIKTELQELQQKVASAMSRHFDYGSLEGYSTMNIASEPEFNYELQKIPEFRSTIEKYLSPKLLFSFLAGNEYEVQEISSHILFETAMIIFIFVRGQEVIENILSETLQSFEAQIKEFDVNSFSQARALLYLTARHHGTKYRRDNGIKGKISFDILKKLLQPQESVIAVQTFFDAYDHLPKRTIRILGLLLEGSTPRQIGRQMGLPASTVLKIKNKAINLLPDTK